MDHRLPPFKGSCRLIRDSHELINGLPQLQWRGEARPLEGLTSQNAKPTLYLVQPRSIGRRIMEMDVAVTAQPAIRFRIVSIQVVQHHMQLAVRMVGHNLVHEIQEFPSATPRIVGGFHLTGGHVQSRKQCSRPVPRVTMAEAGERLPVGETNPALGTLQSLDRRLLIHSQDQGVFGRFQIKADDVGRLGGEGRVGGNTPTATTAQQDTVSPQDPPHLILTDIPQRPGQQAARPGTVPGGGE